MCIFGQGCQGIYADAPDVGCCTLGAHFADKADEKRVAAYVDQLDAEAVAAEAAGSAGPQEGLDRDRRGGRAQDPHHVVDGQQACVFHNRTDFELGAGCALHALAFVLEKNPVETKPDVCWQLPIRRTFRNVERQDGTTYTEVSIGEYDRRGWGPGGHDLDWYCSGNTEAHVAPEPVYVTHEAELTALMGKRGVRRAGRGTATRTSARARRLALHPADPR